MSIVPFRQQEPQRFYVDRHCVDCKWIERFSNPDRADLSMCGHPHVRTCRDKFLVTGKNVADTFCTHARRDGFFHEGSPEWCGDSGALWEPIPPKQCEVKEAETHKPSWLNRLLLTRGKREQQP